MTQATILVTWRVTAESGEPIESGTFDTDPDGVELDIAAELESIYRRHGSRVSVTITTAPKRARR